MFNSKNHLLLHIDEIADGDELVEYAEVVKENPLNDVPVKTKGSRKAILESLKGASKAVLENAFDIVFGDEEEVESDDDANFDDDEE